MEITYRLVEPSTGTTCEIVFDGVTLSTTTTKGAKSRTKTATPTSDARRTAERALVKQLEAGFVLADGALPHPAMFEPPSPDAIRWTLTASDARKEESIVNRMPPCYAALRPVHGTAFVDGPDGYGLLLEPAWAVIRSAVRRPVTPTFQGADHTRLPLRWRVHPRHPHRAAMLFVHGEGLHELDLAEASARHVLSWEASSYVTLKAQHLCYAPSGRQALYATRSQLTAVDLESGRESVVFDRAGDPDGYVQGVAPLADGRVAVLLTKTLVVLRADGDAWTPDEEIPGRGWSVLGAWLGGRMLVVSGLSGNTVVFAARGGPLRPVLTSSLRVTQAYELRGAQWMHVDAHDHEWEPGFDQNDIPDGSKRRKRGPLRVMGLAEAWAEDRPVQAAGPVY